MKKTYFLGMLMLMVLFASCYDEPIDREVDSGQVSENAFRGELIGGMLHFKSQQDFDTSIEFVKTLDDEAIETLMYPFYEEGFEPLYPFYLEGDVERIAKFINEKKLRRRGSSNTQMKSSLLEGGEDDSSDIEQDDDLIGDDYFAALLNIDREIVVNNKLHRYTHEGVFRVDFAKKGELDTYILYNNITDVNIPDPNTITRGLVQVTPSIERFAPEFISGNCGDQAQNVLTIAPANDYPAFYNDFVVNDCGGSYGGGGSSGGGSSTPPTDHTTSLKNYIKDLTPCDSQSGGIFGWNPFGTSRKCFSNHSSRYRTKTKYWNEDLLIYTSIGVKVKHQKKNLWWGAKSTDEVALVINQAMFAKTYPNQIPPYNSLPIFPSNNQRLYFFNGRFYNNVNSIITPGWVPPAERIPETPFQEDIIVQEYIDLPILRDIDDIEIEADELNELFWEDGVWDGAKQLFRSFTGEDPKKITYILTTPQKVYINYVDLTQRKLNTKKIVETLDYDWGGEIKLSWGIDGNGNWTSNINDWSNPLTYFEAFDFTELTEFETISMDFVGVTRRGNTWRGSRVVTREEN